MGPGRGEKAWVGSGPLRGRGARPGGRGQVGARGSRRVLRWEKLGTAMSSGGVWGFGGLRGVQREGSMSLESNCG